MVPERYVVSPLRRQHCMHALDNESMLKVGKETQSQHTEGAVKAKLVDRRLHFDVVGKKVVVEK